MGRPNLYDKADWAKFQKGILYLIEKALVFLQMEDGVDLDEIELNRRLFFCFEGVAHDQHMKYHVPTPEGQNPPDADDIQRAARELKRPDFYWQFSDDTAEDSAHATRRFVLECKRLGTAHAGWAFNCNYIRNGVMRFIDVDHGYGKGDRVGGMVGYVQNMEFADILNEVNATALEVGAEEISRPAGGWKPGGLSRLDHVITRPFNHSPYQIIHTWVDLRSAV